MSYINKDDIQAGDLIVVYTRDARYRRGIVKCDSLGRFIQPARYRGSRVRFQLPGYRIVKHERPSPLMSERDRELLSYDEQLSKAVPAPEWHKALVVRDKYGIYWVRHGYSWLGIGHTGSYSPLSSLAICNPTIVIDQDGKNVEQYAENEKGGEARRIVAEIAGLVGVNLSGSRGIGELWSVKNMRRVVDAVESDHRLRNAFGNQLAKISGVLAGTV